MADAYSLSVDGIALGAGVAKTIIELATPASRSARLAQWWVEFDGTSAANTPVKVELMRGSATITGTTLTPVKYNDPNAPASLVTAKHTATVEGTATDLMESHRVPPTGGLVIQYPLGREPEIALSTFLRIRCTAAQAVNVTVGAIWEE